MSKKIVASNAHCSYCVHYEPCIDCSMYCKMLKRRITARKKPCKHYECIYKVIEL